MNGGGGSLGAFVVILLAAVGGYYLIQQAIGHNQPPSVAQSAPQTVMVQCQDGSIQATCPPVAQNPPQVQQPQPADASQQISANSQPDTASQSDPSANAQPTTCEEIVDQKLGGPAALGGDASAWHAPDWAQGAWTYFGPAAELQYPGFGWFDSWPDHGGLHQTQNFMAPPGYYRSASDNQSAASFHCQ